MLWSVGSQRVGHDLVTEQQHRNSKLLELTAANGWYSLARVQSRKGARVPERQPGEQRRRSQGVWRGRHGGWGEEGGHSHGDRRPVLVPVLPPMHRSVTSGRSLTLSVPFHHLKLGMMLLLLRGCWFQEDDKQHCPWTWGLGALTLGPILAGIPGLTFPRSKGFPGTEGRCPAGACAPLLVAVDSVAQSSLTLCDPMGCGPPGSLSMGFPRQECWSGLPFPPPGDLPDPGIKPGSPALAGGFSAAEPPGRLLCSPPRPHLSALELPLSLKCTSRFFPTCGLPSV